MSKDEVAVQGAIGGDAPLEEQDGFEYLTSLPPEIQLQIFGHLGQPELYALRQTSSGMNDLVSKSGLADIYLTPENYKDKKILDNPNARFRCLKIDMGLKKNVSTAEADDYYTQCFDMLEKVQKLKYKNIDLSFSVYPSASMGIQKILYLANLCPIPKKVNFRLCFDFYDIEGLYTARGNFNERQPFTTLFIAAALKSIPGADFCFFIDTDQANQHLEHSAGRLLTNVGHLRHLLHWVDKAMKEKEFREVEIKGPGLITSAQGLSASFSKGIFDKFLFLISNLPSKKLTIKNPPCGPMDMDDKFKTNLYNLGRSLASKLDHDGLGHLINSNINIIFEQPIPMDNARTFCEALFDQFNAVFKRSGTASQKQISVTAPGFSETKTFSPKQTVPQPIPSQRAPRPGSFIGRQGWQADRL